MSLPYFPLYVDDFEADTAHLTLLEDGIYNRLLRLMWRTPGCKAPDDMEWLKRKLRISKPNEIAALKRVLGEFFQRKRGKIFSPRLLSEFETISVTVQRRSEAGKRGGAAKHMKKKKTGSSPALAGLKQPEPEPDITPQTPQGGHRSSSRYGVPEGVRLKLLGGDK